MRIQRCSFHVRVAMVATAFALVAIFPNTGAVANSKKPNGQTFRNDSGEVQTISTQGGIDLNSAFFKPLGTNGRSCASCHQESDGWSVTPEHLRARFDADGGLDPVFRPNDGAVCPTADVSTRAARRQAYRLLLKKGLIRVSMPIPANAEFSLYSVDDPYGCATAQDLSLYRRPLPSTNLRFLSAVMWDGRETAPGQSILADLHSQANDATLGHAQAAQAPTPQQVEDIVQFELALATAQLRDDDAGKLDTRKANGGPLNLLGQEFFIGINDPLGQNPTGKDFDPNAFGIYSAWADRNFDDDKDKDQRSKREARESVARGEALFNNFPIAIEGVGGLNDALNVTTINGTCTTCHDSPNVGNHSVVAPLNIGVVDASHRTADMPLYTFQCNLTGEKIQVTDPGRALISGKCKDIGKFKGPVLRGLASRAPYFHNGSAATLMDAVEFYNTRFKLNLTHQQKDDLVAFLKTL